VTEAVQPRPVPGPPRSGRGPSGPGPSVPSGPNAGPDAGTVPDAGPDSATVGDAGLPFADLADRPVADHVAVYEAEHERLQRELSTVDQL
jgi:hypothetical protein